MDSERLAGLLEREGYRLVFQPEGASLAVVNTCGFVAAAREEAHTTIAEMLRLKAAGLVGRVVVVGCLVEWQREELLQQYPEVDGILGVFARDEITAAVRALEKEPDKQYASLPPACNESMSELGRRRLTLPHVAYLKIAEGCNRACSFCTIPRIRGPYRSKPLRLVIEEAEQLAADGTRELVLIAQDTTYYGIDTSGRPLLAELLRKLEDVSGLRWIRLMYLYPMHITDELLDVIAGSKKILPYLDLPLQHINDEVLRRMRRGIDRPETERLLDRLRKRISSPVLRTTLMTGFPGETEQQFEELLAFVRQQRFERLGVFAFSAEPHTPAAELVGQVPEKIARERRDRVMAAQQEISFAWSAAQVGRRMEVIVDQPFDARRHVYLGRSWADAPDIDGRVYITGKKLSSGEIVCSEIVAAEGYDLIAFVCDDADAIPVGPGKRFHRGSKKAKRR